MKTFLEALGIFVFALPFAVGARLHNITVDVPPPQGCEWVEMVRVIDGDTIVVGDDTTVRFLSTDAPESVHPDRPATLRGFIASQWLKRTLRDDLIVCLEYGKGETTKDKYGRTLADVYTEDNIDISRRMVKFGLAEPW